MDIDEVMRSLSWRGIAVILMAAIVAAGVGLLGTMAVSPTYTATARIYVGIPLPPSTGGAGSLAAFPRERLVGYGSLVQSRPVLQQAISDGKLSGSVEDLLHAITTTAPKDTALLDITVSESSAEAASRSANAVAQSLTEAITGIESPSPFRVTVVSPATPPALPSAPYTLRIMILLALVGGALGVAWVLRDLFRRELSIDTVEYFRRRSQHRASVTTERTS